MCARILFAFVLQGSSAQILNLWSENDKQTEKAQGTAQERNHCRLSFRPILTEPRLRSYYARTRENDSLTMKVDAPNPKSPTL